MAKWKGWVLVVIIFIGFVAIVTPTLNKINASTVKLTNTALAIYEAVSPGMDVAHTTEVVQKLAPKTEIKKFNQIGYDIWVILWGDTNKNKISTSAQTAIVFKGNIVFEVDYDHQITTSDYIEKTNRIKSNSAAQH